MIEAILTSSWKSKLLTPPPKYVQASMIVSMGGLLFGLDTGTIGPLTVMPQFDETFGTLSATVVRINHPSSLP
jgi:hypothetical protein